PNLVVAARGISSVTGLQTRGGDLPCDLVVVCGHRIPDAGLITQAGGRIEWNPTTGAFMPVEMPSNVTAVGEVKGLNLTPAVELPPPDLSPSTPAVVVFFSAVTPS